MPSIVTQFVLLDLVRDRMEKSSDPAQRKIASILIADPAYVH